MVVDMVEKPHVALGERIRLARRAKGWTETQLAAHPALDVSPRIVSRWESGETQPRGRLRRDLAVALDVHYHVLFLPESVAETLTSAQRRLLLSARHRARGGDHLYLATIGSSATATAQWLAHLYLVEDNGPEDAIRLWHLTGPGEDVLAILQRDGGPR